MLAHSFLRGPELARPVFQVIMRKLTKTLSQLSGGFDEEDERLLNPDDRPEELGISLSELRHLTEVVFKAGSIVSESVCLRDQHSI